jgi:hypothetical protein
MLAGCLIGMQPDTPWKVSLLTTEIICNKNQGEIMEKSG